MKVSYACKGIQQSAFQHLFRQRPLTDFLFLYIMSKQEFLTTEERERQKAARRRFREIVKQRWQEEQLKKLSKKAFKKLNKYANSPLSLGEVVGNCRVSEKGVRTPQPDLMVLAEEAGGSLRVRFSKGVWYLHFTFFGKKVESAAPTLTEAINGLIINKHLNK